MKRINYKRIAKQLQVDLKSLSSARKARTLDETDVDEAIEALKIARRRAPDADSWRVVSVGGHVANGYGYRAETDKIEITVTAEGSALASATRATASSRPRGNGSTLIARAIKPGQSQGSIVYRA